MSTRGEPIRLGTRSSDLALAQASLVKQRLADRRIRVELVEVETTGDELREAAIRDLGTTGAFVRALDERVLEGDLDGAVHSMKDMPTEGPADLVVAGVPDRGPAGDVLLTPAGTSLAALPAGATIGTSSLRREAQLRAAYPSLHIEGLRGNVDTRVEKLVAPSLQSEHDRRLEAAADDGDEATDSPGEMAADSDEGDAADREYEQSPSEWVEELSPIERRALEREVETTYDAICLAEAGLQRSDLLSTLPVERLSPHSFVPAPAQGAIAVTARDGDTARRIHDVLDHPPTRVAVTVERTILGELGGGCVAPVGIHARLQGEVVATTARILSRDGSEEVRASRELPVQRHAEAAADFATDLADEGATDLIDRARRDTPDGAKRG